MQNGCPSTSKTPVWEGTVAPCGPGVGEISWTHPALAWETPGLPHKISESPVWGHSSSACGVDPKWHESLATLVHHEVHLEEYRASPHEEDLK